MWSGAKVISEENEEIELSVFGFELAEMLPLNKLVIPDDYEVENFTGHKVIMSSVLAEEIRIREGDNIKLTIWERDFRFQVDLVIRPTAPLAVDPWNKIILMPIDFFVGANRCLGAIS